MQYNLLLDIWKWWCMSKKILNLPDNLWDVVWKQCYQTAEAFSACSLSHSPTDWTTTALDNSRIPVTRGTQWTRGTLRLDTFVTIQIWFGLCRFHQVLSCIRYTLFHLTGESFIIYPALVYPAINIVYPSHHTLCFKFYPALDILISAHKYVYPSSHQSLSFIKDTLCFQVYPALDILYFTT